MAKRTVIENEEISHVLGISNTSVKPINVDSERKLVGFLVSFSASENGEYWPIREGRNLIGSSSQSNIQMYDSLVSANHAVLVIRRSKNDDRLMFTLTDQQSSNGTFVNDRDIESSAYECKDRDLIKIGKSSLLLVAFDKKALSLEIDEDLKKQRKTESKSEKSQSRTSPYDYPASKGTTIENS